MRTAHASHRLGEVERYAKADRNLDLPPIEYRENLEPGDLAMLLDEEIPEDVAPLWAEIDQVLGPGWYLGRTEYGHPVEFGAQHIADIESPRFGNRRTLGPSMGAWYDAFRQEPSREKPPVSGAFRHFERRQRGAAPPPPPEQPRGPRPSIFDVFKRGAPGSFFDIFRRKPKVDVGPIPPAERRPERPLISFLRPKGQEPSPSPDLLAYEPPPGVQEAVPEAGQGVIPLEPQATLQPMSEAGQAPLDMFSVLLPEEERELPPAPPQAPSGAVIVAPEVRLPAGGDMFSILEPETEMNRFGPPAAGPSPFELLLPEQQAPSAFDLLVPETEIPSGGMVVRPETGGLSTASIFDILEPEAPERGVSIYEPPPPGPTLFEPLAPPPAPAEREAEPVSKPCARGKKKQAGSAWRMPTREEWLRWIQKRFDVPDLFKYLEKERQGEWFVSEQLNEDDTGEPPVIPIETWASMEWDLIFEFFDIPEEVWQPYIKKIESEESNDGYADDGWENLNQDLIYPIGDEVSKAFKSIQPNSLPGRIVLDDDGQTGTWGLLYYEALPEEQVEKRRKELKTAQAKFQKEQSDKEKHRKAQIKKIWGQMPKPEDIVPWIEERFDLDAMFADIKKTRKTKNWKEQLRENGDATMDLEIVVDIGRSRPRQYDYEIASYFGIPPDVVALYQDSESEQELWSEVFWPFFDNIREAFSMLLPYADLPGWIAVEEDEEDHLAIQYFEEEK